MYDLHTPHPISLKTIALHLFLFLLTLLSTTLAGAEWMFGGAFLFGEVPMGWEQFWSGMLFSVPFLAILTVHEFGHYLFARYYRLQVSLPYYIPAWFFGLSLSIGTMGAFIRIQSPIFSRRAFFDVGIAGPLAGFVVALGVVIYGFTHLPDPTYIFKIHPDYEQYGLDYAKYVYQDLPGSLKMGTNLLFEICKWALVDDPRLIPNDFEIFHYPFLLAGYLACFFTALNLIPIGQLDGGHVLSAMIGYDRFNRLAPFLFYIFMFFGGLGLFSLESFQQDWESALYGSALYAVFLFVAFSRVGKTPVKQLLLVSSLYGLQFAAKTAFPEVTGFYGWLLFGLLLGRFLGVKHPSVYDHSPLDTKRKILGWAAWVVFILTFSPTPFILVD